MILVSNTAVMISCQIALDAGAIQPVASALVLSSELQQLNSFMVATAALITRAIYR